jgi:predicted nucleic acid-binding protein
MTVCLDASVVLKLLIYETDSERAVQWLNSHEGEELVAPTFLFAEVASVLQRRVRMGEVTAQERKDALDALESIQIRPIWDYALIRQATALADEIGQPTVYDTIYLAVAERERCIFLTADQRFAKAASGTYSSVQLL